MSAAQAWCAVRTLGIAYTRYMFSPLLTLQRFDRHQQRAALLALGLLPWVRLSLRCIGLARTARQLGVVLTAATPEVATLIEKQQVRRIARAVAGAARRAPGGSHCLTRSLVLLYCLQQRGLLGSLRVGVTAPGDFRAHAWVEFGGEALNETARNLSQYETLGALRQRAS